MAALRKKPKKAAKKSQSKAEHPRKRGRTPAQLDRQSEIFDMSVCELLSYRQIIAAFKERGESLSMDTVVADIRHEEQRRADELGARRETEKARSVAFYESVQREGMRLAKKSDDAFMQPLARGLDSAVKARERIDKILGLDAPTKVELGIQSLLESLDVPADKA